MMNDELKTAFQLLENENCAADHLKAALIFQEAGEAYEKEALCALKKAAEADEPHALFLLGERSKDEETRLYYYRKAAHKHPEACYRLALIEKNKDQGEYRRLLKEAAQQLYLPAVARWIEENKRSERYEDRYEADIWILQSYGMGLCGYEIPTARMLFEGIGVYSGAALGATNRKRAVEILLQVEECQEKALLLGKYLLTADRLPSTLMGKQNVCRNLLPPPDQRLPSYPQQGIRWLEKADCAEAYAFLGDYYLENGEKENAKLCYQRAYEKEPDKRYAKMLCALTSKETIDPEEKLNFLFTDEDPKEKLRTLKKALWEVTHEGYCRSMKKSLEEGVYDPDALLWQKLFPMKDDIEALYEKYKRICEE